MGCIKKQMAMLLMLVLVFTQFGSTRAYAAEDLGAVAGQTTESQFYAKELSASAEEPTQSAEDETADEIGESPDAGRSAAEVAETEASPDEEMLEDDVESEEVLEDELAEQEETAGPAFDAEVEDGSEAKDKSKESALMDGEVTAYRLWVGNTQVTSDNKDNIPSVIGEKASYDPETRTLTLKNVTGVDGTHEGPMGKALIYAEGTLTIAGNAYFINAKEAIGIYSDTLIINGKLEIIGAERGSIKCSNEIRVEGEDSVLHCESVGDGGTALLTAARINILGGKVTLKNNIYDAIAAVDTVTIKGGTLTAEGKERAIFAVRGITIGDNMTITVPENGKVDGSDKYTIVDKDGEVAKSIKIEPSNVTKYPLWIGDTQVTSANKDNIPGETGSASYDPDTKTLTCNTLVGVKGKYVFVDEEILIYSEDDLVIDGRILLDNSDADYGIYCTKNLTVKGSVDVMGFKQTPLYVAETLTISDESAQLSAEGQENATYAPVTAKNIIISGGSVVATSKYSAIGMKANNNMVITGGYIYTEGRVTGLESGITIGFGNSMEIVQPEGGRSAGIYVIDKDGNAAKVVQIAPKELITEYDLWVGDIQATNKNQDAIYAGLIGYATYDPETNRLVFNDVADLSGYHTDHKGNKTLIYAKEDLTIEGKGVLKHDDADIGIKTDSKLTLKGDITASGKTSAVFSEKGIAIGEGYMILSPVGGYVKDKTIVNASGVTATEVKIGATPPNSKVSFDLNGKSGTVPAEQSVAYGKTASRPSTDPSAEGFKFTGWYTEAGCVNKYDFAAPVTADVQLFAGWEEIKKYTVIFSMNGHGTAIAPIKVEEGKAVARPVAPADDSYKFAGWFTQKDCSESSRYDFSLPVNKDMTLYAGWKRVDIYTVTFEQGKGGLVIPQFVADGEKAEEPKDYPGNSAPPDYTFAGWYSDKKLTRPYNFDAPVHSDLVIYSKWVKSSVGTCAVSFKMNGHGNPVMPQIVEKKKKAVQPDIPIDKVMQFAGWYADEQLETNFDFTKPIVADTVVYAKWVEPDPEGISVRFEVDESFTFNEALGRYEQVYTGSAIKPNVIVTTNAFDPVPLKQGADYTVKYSGNTKVDKNGKAAVVTITGKGNYKGTKKLYFYILPKSLGNANGRPASGIEIDDEIFVLKGGNVIPTIVYNGIKLGNADYTLDKKKFTDEDQDPENEMVLTITGKGNYTGFIQRNVKVLSAADKRAKSISVTLKTSVSYVYDGSIKSVPEEQLEVKDGEGNILSKEYYDISYGSNRKDVGTVKFLITGKNGYTGAVSKSFKITPDKNTSTIQLSLEENSVTYVKDGAKPEVTVDALRTGEAPLRLAEGKDYTVKYSGNTKVTTKASCKVTFIGNYKGRKAESQTFTITPAPFDADKVTVRANNLVYQGTKKYLVTPHVVYDGVQLSKKDYTVVYYLVDGEDISNKKYSLPDEYESVPVTMVIRGKGNYSEKELTFENCYSIMRKPENVIDLKKVKVYKKGKFGKSIPAQNYTGRPVVPEFDIFVIAENEWRTIDDKELGLVEGVDYDVTIFNNVAKGTATIIVTSNSKSNRVVNENKVTFNIAVKTVAELAQLVDG